MTPPEKVPHFLEIYLNKDTIISDLIEMANLNFYSLIHFTKLYKSSFQKILN